MTPEQKAKMREGREGRDRLKKEGSDSTPDAWIYEPKQAIMLQDVSEDGLRYLAAFKAAYKGGSRAAAMQAMCLSCVWLDLEAIRDCKASECPLWALRPYQKARPRKERKERKPLDKQA